MRKKSFFETLAANAYPGRGIAVGRSQDGKSAVLVYFIMGRSVNSRNRVFIQTDDGIRTEAFDPKRLTDPSLIIYSPVRVLGATSIVTNGDQTDTVYDALKAGGTFEQALRTRTFEPDAPNFTPRISAAVTLQDGGFFTRMSIIKSNQNREGAALRYWFEYENMPAGEARFLHTYMGNGDPLPSFEGEPETVSIEGGMESFTARTWNSLNKDNRISLFVRYIDLSSGKFATAIVNEHS